MPSSATTCRTSSLRSLRIAGLVVLVGLLITGCNFPVDVGQLPGSSQPGPAPSPFPVERTSAPLHRTATSGPAAQSIAVFFSDPISGRATGGPEEHLVAAINAAQQSVDVAVFNISHPDIVNALIAADERGVIVRLVLESEALDGRQVARLMRAGIPLVTDQREGLMHNKFTVIDGSEVWSGSANYTATAFYNDFNNLIRLRSQRAAQNYTTEFEEMFNENLFGEDDRPATPYPQFIIDGVPVEVYFSPDDGAAGQIIAAIRQARHSIDFMAYSFTSDDIAEAVRDQAAAGVTVRGVFDASQVSSNTGGEFDAFQAAGIAVRRDRINGLMHHKVILIDRQVVITGSYNFSASAERRNDENVIIVHHPALAALYQDHFEIVYQNGD